MNKQSDLLAKVIDKRLAELERRAGELLAGLHQNADLDVRYLRLALMDAYHTGAQDCLEAVNGALTPLWTIAGINKD